MRRYAVRRADEETNTMGFFLVVRRGRASELDAAATRTI